MSRRGPLKTQIRQLREAIDEQTHTDILSEALWLGSTSRESVISLETEPNIRTGKIRANAATLGLRLLDTVTFPMLLRERRRLPGPRHGYAWDCEGWTAAALTAFFDWLDDVDPDLDDLDDELADRYRTLLAGAAATWATDADVSGSLSRHVAAGVVSTEALAAVVAELGEVPDDD